MDAAKKQHKSIPPSIGSQLRSLVRHYVPTPRFDSALAVATRLLDSSLTTAPSMQSSDALTRSMTFRLMRDGCQEAADNLGTLTTSLKFEPAISQPALWPILYILNDLRGSASSLPPRKKTVPSRHTAPSMPTASAAATAATTSTNPAAKSAATTTAPSATAPPPLPDLFEPAAQPVDLHPTSEDEETDRVIASARKARTSVSMPRIPPTRVASSSPLQNRSLENALVQDLMLIVQGDDGRQIAFVGDREKSQIRLNLPPAVTLSLPMFDMVHCIAELGFLFRVIRAHIAPSTATASSARTLGLVTANLHTAIDRELENYYRSLVTLRESRRDTSHHAVDDRLDAVPPEDMLTLRKTFVWAERERHRLRWLARLCEETRPLHGGQIVAHLRSRRGSYVATDIRDMMSRIVASTAAPLNMMLVRWLSEGVLPDAHGEFFIMTDPKVAVSVAPNPFSAEAVEEGGLASGLAGGPNMASAASNRIWWGLFKLRPDMLPGSVDSNTAQNALITGKSVAFMRRCCSDSEWVDEFHVPLVLALTSGDTKLFEADCKYDDNTVRELVEKARVSATKRLKELFFERFDLNHHFGAIKKYLLLSQGDFATALMDGLATLLDGGGEILQHNLTGYVDTALQNSSSFNEETDWDILERLDVQIEVGNEDAAANVGWDVFSLTYRVEDAPLNTVFSPKVMDAYLLVFRLLWRLKRMQHLMSLGYMSLREVESANRRRRKLAEQENESTRRKRKEKDCVLKRIHFLRMKMTHFIHNMQHYCKVEVLEGCWAVLEREMKEAEDLDGMIMSHAQYLTMIKDMTLQSDRSRYVAAELNAVLDTVPRFSQLQNQVYNWAMSDLAPRKKKTTTDGQTAEQLLEILSEIERDFDLRFDRLLQVLSKHCQMVDACVFLLFRLDFNQFYSHRSEKSFSPGRLGQGPTTEEGSFNAPAGS